MITTILNICNEVIGKKEGSVSHSLVARNVTIVEVDNIVDSGATEIYVMTRLQDSSNWKIYQIIDTTESDALVLIDPPLPIVKVIAKDASKKLVVKVSTIQGII